MGLIYSNARLLLAGQQDGFSFQNVATLGRQQLYLSQPELRKLGDEFGFSAHDVDPWTKGRCPYVDEFFHKCLGCDQLTSIDCSSYQDASLVHDLNLPIDESLHQQFDAVIDGGTLEHIFHVPTAIQNCMQMVRVGGCIMLVTTANNYCGHGFYQFSPEFFYRVFQPANGYEIKRVILVSHPYPGADLSSNQTCYEVVDPDSVGSRVGLVSCAPVMIQILAKRISDASLTTFPQQSDYESLWKAQSPFDTASAPDESLQGIARMKRMAGNIKRSLVAKLPASVEKRMAGRRQLREYSLSNRKYYRPW